MAKDKITPALTHVFDGAHEIPARYVALTQPRDEAFGLHVTDSDKIGLSLSEPETFQFSAEELAKMQADALGLDPLDFDTLA